MAQPTRIQAVFDKLKSNGQLAFMPFITAGDPDLSATAQILQTLAASGVDLIEVGFPYSDPIADGPVIQAAYTRALAHKIKVQQIFETIRGLDHSQLPPLVGMVSYALVFRNSPQQFVKSAAEAGFSGLIVPDLPGDEAADLKEIVSAHGMDLVQLIAPTTPPERATRILKSCSGFVYCVSISGTTGERDQLPQELRDQLQWLREQTDLPLAVGFGISKPEQVDFLRGSADGVIIGSAIVRKLEPLSSGSVAAESVFQDVRNFAREMVQATHAQPTS